MKKSEYRRYRDNIINKIKEQLYCFDDIIFAYIFGSFAKELETPLSDIDIAIYQKGNKKKYNLRMYEFEVEAALSEKINNVKFDVRSLNDAPIIVIGKIMVEGKLLFVKDKVFFDRYRIQHHIKYMDYKIIYDPLIEEKFSGLLND